VTLLIDFHTHTNASDGELAPAVLIARAREAGIAALAITDHDTLAGYHAAQTADLSGIELVPGVEISCVWGGTTIHVVGLGFDPAAPAMVAILQRLTLARNERAVKISERLGARNIPGALEGAQAIAGDSQIGRPHFAQWMVAEGHVSSMNSAFDKYLGQGKIGDVKTFWPTLESAVTTIVESGGMAILAHPLKYKFTRMKLNALCQDFKALGGVALEILNGRQTDGETARLKQLAGQCGLQASAGSDFHRDWQYGAALGVEAAIAGDMPAVWETLL
jgi:predicted metal-dependent phosphoesterase TrpH